MGRGRGGYVSYQTTYKDSAGKTVDDYGVIFVAERYIDMGYESVFRRKHEPDRFFDLTIKSSDDKNFIKNIEVKKITSNNPSKIATRIKDANGQFPDGKVDTIALYLEKMKNTKTARDFVKSGFNEAKRKGYVKGKIEFWFSDKTRLILE